MLITALQILVLSAYLLAVYNRYGILQSISHSTYEWIGNQRYWFTAMCWGLGILNLFQGMEGWGVLVAVAMGVTGITINYRTIGTALHNIGAITAIGGGLIGLWALHGIWLPFGLFIPIAICLWFISGDNRIWWIEIVAFALIIIGYTLR